MNDFTKEELEILMYGIHLSIDEHTQHKYTSLANKIQHMIDNYCEHEWIYGSPYEKAFCKKCWIDENYDDKY